VTDHTTNSSEICADDSPLRAKSTAYSG
jgi:hypothetical protein